ASRKPTMTPVRVLVVSQDTHFIEALKGAFPNGTPLNCSISPSVQDACRRAQREGAAAGLLDLPEAAGPQASFPLLWSVTTPPPACGTLALTGAQAGGVAPALNCAGAADCLRVPEGLPRLTGFLGDLPGMLPRPRVAPARPAPLPAPDRAGDAF